MRETESKRGCLGDIFWCFWGYHIENNRTVCLRYEKAVAERAVQNLKRLTPVGYGTPMAMILSLFTHSQRVFQEMSRMIWAYVKCQRFHHSGSMVHVSPRANS